MVNMVIKLEKKKKKGNESNKPFDFSRSRLRECSCVFELVRENRDRRRKYNNPIQRLSAQSQKQLCPHGSSQLIHSPAPKARPLSLFNPSTFTQISENEEKPWEVSFFSFSSAWGDLFNQCREMSLHVLSFSPSLWQVRPIEKRKNKHINVRGDWGVWESVIREKRRVTLKNRLWDKWQ